MKDAEQDTPIPTLTDLQLDELAEKRMEAEEIFEEMIKAGFDPS